MSVPRLQHRLAVLLAAAVPAWDRIETRRVRRSADPRARVQSYRRAIAMLRGLSALAPVAMPPSELLRPAALDGFLARLGTAHGVMVRVMAALLIGLALPVLATRASPSAPAQRARPLEAMSWSCPTGRRSAAGSPPWPSAPACARSCSAAASCSATSPNPRGDPAETAAVLVAAVVFAPEHTYQGALGVATTALMALGMTALFVASRSLCLPIMVHTLIDLRVLLLWPGDSRPAPAQEPDGTAR